MDLASPRYALSPFFPALNQELDDPEQDTALCFDALNELPGPYIKDFLSNIGHEGLNKLLAAYPDKSATALCTFAYCASPDSDPVLFEGRTRGYIVPARGPGNFGWDPIFEVEGTGKTQARLCHHRGSAADLCWHIGSLRWIQRKRMSYHIGTKLCPS